MSVATSDACKKQKQVVYWARQTEWKRRRQMLSIFMLLSRKALTNLLDFPSLLLNTLDNPHLTCWFYPASDLLSQTGTEPEFKVMFVRR